MTELRYQNGDMLFREGDPSTFAVRIVSGELEVLREVEGQMLSLGIIETGEWLGEMGVIENRPRIGSARAIGDVTVEFVDKQDFLRRISEDKDLAYDLILRLSERLTERVRASFGPIGRPVPTAVITETSPSEAEPASPEPEISLTADSEGLLEEMSPEGLCITSFPFIVGRELGYNEPPPPYMIDLAIEDARPYRISRQHFSIEETDGSFQVRDLDSHLGTWVDGQLLGTDFGRDSKILLPGEHRIVAGGTDSPYRFRVVVPDAG